MPSWSASSLCLAGLLAAATSLHAQASPTASRSAGDFQAGAGVLFLNPDYDNTHNEGVTGYVDYEFSRFVGVEAEAHFGGLISPTDLTENSYLAGPRAIYRFHKVAAYGKLLFGRATIEDQTTNDSSAFNVYAFGGGVEYRVKPHLNIRAFDIELQKWPNFEPHTLSPIAITVGAAYIFR